MRDNTSEKRSLKRVRRKATKEQIRLTVPQAAALIGKTERATWLDVYRGRLPYHRHGKSVFFLRSELETFLARLDGVSVEEALERVSQ